MIYCVEDDSNIRELVVYTLESTGMKACGFPDGTAFMKALAFETPELVLLDIMLPGEDGISLLKKLKSSAKTKDIPVIMVTAKGAEYDNLILEQKKHEVRVDGIPVTLTLKEFELLELLIRNKNIVLSRDRLLEEVWGYDFDGETRTIDVHIRTLRQKLKSAGDLIETVRGVGYRMGGQDET